MKKRSSYNVIIDTNILISSLMGKEVSRLNEILAKEKITVIFSVESWNEFFRVIKRPKLKKYFAQEKIKILIVLLSHISKIVKVKSKVSACRDDKDNFLLELSKDSKADFLVSGDNDLLVLKNFEGTKIISFSQFLEIMNV